MFGEVDLLELLLVRIFLLGLGVKVLDWEDRGRGESLESSDSGSDTTASLSSVLSLLGLDSSLILVAGMSALATETSSTIGNVSVALNFFHDSDVRFFSTERLLVMDLK